jgi:bifunctional non-homologous end joining protein LigD
MLPDRGVTEEGYPLQIVAEGGQPRIFTRQVHDWSDRLGLLRACAEKLLVQNALVDGEAIVFDARGLSA